MATLETQKLDSIIASRRSLLMGAGALAATAMIGTKTAAAAVPATPTDVQILNFALNLEYLEAQFYTIATEGVTADQATQGSKITLPSGSGTVTFRAGAKTTFANAAVAAYAFETAIEERKHVLFLQTALGSAAVAQPNINLQSSFTTLGGLLGVPTFDPFTTDLNFLLGSYIFEDVGVTAYHGGALGITNKGKTGQTADYLTPAAGIHAVEAFHAGLVRVTLASFDAGLVTLGTQDQTMKGQAAGLATAISNLRATLDGTVGQAPTDTAGLTGQDDFGLATYSVPTNGTTGTASRILNQGRTTSPGYSNFIGFHRTYQQVLNIVYASAGGAFTANSFFPSGMNGDIK
jgi:hypothetical protein